MDRASGRASTAAAVHLRIMRHRVTSDGSRRDGGAAARTSDQSVADVRVQVYGGKAPVTVNTGGRRPRLPRATLVHRQLQPARVCEARAKIVVRQKPYS